jgi:MFS family permease
MPVLLVSEVFMWTLYGNIATFYPPYKKEHHPTITDTMVGVVLAMFEGGVLIFSPIVSLLIPKVGRKNFIIIGNIAMILASIGFGLMVHVDNDMNFFIISIALRMISGLGDAAGSTAIFSIIGSEFPEKRELYFGYFESAVGVGLMLGPVLGQIFYTALGFEKTFYCTAIILGIPFIL